VKAVESTGAACCVLLKKLPCCTTRLYIERRDTVYLPEPGGNSAFDGGIRHNNMILLLDVSGFYEYAGKASAV
jgi:hypothetical protein